MMPPIDGLSVMIRVEVGRGVVDDRGEGVAHCSSPGENAVIQFMRSFLTIFSLLAFTMPVGAAASKCDAISDLEAQLRCFNREAGGNDLPMPALPDPTAQCRRLPGPTANLCPDGNQQGYEITKEYWTRLSESSAIICIALAKNNWNVAMATSICLISRAQISSATDLLRRASEISRDVGRGPVKVRSDRAGRGVRVRDAGDVDVVRLVDGHGLVAAA